jgi:hypothetical protein
MAWNTAQEHLVAEIISTEIAKRIEAGQFNIVAMLIDPALTNAQKVAVVKTRLNTRKTADQTELAALTQRGIDAAAFLNADIALIDSILTQLP